MEGVEILLTDYTRVPFWIAWHNGDVKIERQNKGSGSVRSLRVEGGEARFRPDGKVEIKLPGFKRFVQAFDDKKVLEIRGLPHGNLLEGNFCFCHTCFKNTGEMVDESMHGKEYECTECHRTWTL